MDSPADRTIVSGILRPNATVVFPGREGRRSLALSEQGKAQLLPYNKKAAKAPRRQHRPAADTAARGIGAVGVDDRRRVVDPTEYPFSAVCSLRMFFPNGEYAGTGFMIGPHTVCTAAHNLKNKDLGGRAAAVDVYPGLNGSLSNHPLPSVRAEQSLYTKSWDASEPPDEDYGALVLPTELGNDVGCLATAKYADGDLRGLAVNNLSYPEDCPASSAGNCPEPYTGMYFQNGNIIRFEDQKLYYSNMLMTLGTSGSPIFAYYPDDPPESRYRVLGIHTWGLTSEPYATRINDEVFAMIQYWLSLGSQNP